MKTKLVLTITENDQRNEAASVTLESDDALATVFGALIRGMRRGLEDARPLSPDAEAAVTAVMSNTELTEHAQRLVGDATWIAFLEAASDFMGARKT